LALAEALHVEDETKTKATDTMTVSM
jgi:hypothetical protein